MDIRGAFWAPLPAILGLEKPRETLEPKGIVGGVEVEMVGHEIEKCLRLLVKPNGYVLGQIFSPLVVLTSPAHEELKMLAQAGLSKRLYHHYAGFARGEWRDYQKVAEKPGVGKTVKRLLYLHRVLMTGIVLLNEGVIEANLHRLNRRFGLDLEPLLAMKTREQADVEGEDATWTATVGSLFEELDAAWERSILPDDVPNRRELSEFLIRLRLSGVPATG